MILEYESRLVCVILFMFIITLVKKFADVCDLFGVCAAVFSKNWNITIVLKK